MNKNQDTQFKMLKSTAAVMDKHLTLWNPIPKIAEAKADLSQSIRSIQAASQVKDEARVYLTEEKQEVKRSQAKKMDILDDVLYAYATVIGDPKLQQLADNTMTDYYGLPNEQFVVRVKGMIELVEKHIRNLADYGITPAMVKDARTTFTTFEEMNGLPRTYQDASIAATRDLQALFEAAMNLVKHLDNLMAIFRQSEPSFYAEYRAARRLVG